jgi:A/G-specific adenine glycosylase
MLQQTQIATVTPYFERFITAFPTVSDLAAAPLEKVLELWSGLGYYRRARHLHQAAQTVAKLPGAAFPQDSDALRALSGIGDYTARAILSIAFNKRYAVLDGNVARVVARLHSLRGNVHQPEFCRTVEQELSLLLSPRKPGDFNQAMMELGQTICLPRGPLCPTCPVSKWCLGFQSGNPEEFPLPRPRRATEAHHLAIALIRRGNEFALVRGLEDGLLNDLWNFPAALGATQKDALAALGKKLAGLTRARLTLGQPIAQIRHTITYRSIQGHVFPVQAPRSVWHKSVKWLPLEEIPKAAISQLARKVVQKLCAS